MSAMISKKKLFACLLCVSVCIILKKHVANMVLTHFPQRSCKKCLPECDLGAMKRFNKSVEPFLSAKCTLSEVAFTWWKGLQNEKRDFISYKATVDHLLKMFPAAPDVVGASPDRCRTCAVVGNSANLKGSLYGTLIDFHDVIIRMNQGHTKGYEADVGTITNIHIMYPESAIDLDDNTHLVLVPFKIMDLEWLIQAFTTGFTGESYRPIKSKIKANKDMVMVVNPDFMRYVHETWLEKKGTYPSTGFMAFVLALHICDEVHVFGYGADKDGNWDHYWEKLTDPNLRTGIHPGIDEYKIIQQLAEKQIVTFYTGL